jgi:hypothetical protein
MLGCWVRLGLRIRLLRIHMLKCAKLSCRQYVIISNHYIFTWELLFSTFLILGKLEYIFLVSHLRNIGNLEYIREFLVFVTGLFEYIYISERSNLHDDLINWKFL